MKILERAVAAHRRGDYEEAIRICQRLLKSRPADARLHACLGMAWLRAGKLDDAEAEFRQALRLDSRQREALEGIVALLHRRGFADAARTWAEVATEAHPLLAGFWVVLAQLHAEQGRRAEALQVALRGMAAGAGSTRLWGLAAELAYHEQGPAAALQLLARKPPAVPVDCATIYLLGACHHALHQVDDAERAFRAVLAQQPGHRQAMLGLAEQCRLSGRRAEAESLLRRIVTIDPDAAEARNTLGVMLMAQHRLPEALELVRQALALQPRNPEILNSMGTLHALLGQPDRAIEFFRATISLRPGDAVALNNLGNALKVIGDRAGALAVFEQAMASQADTQQRGYLRLAKHLEIAITAGNFETESTPAWPSGRAGASFSVIVCSHRQSHRDAITAHYRQLFEGQDWELIVIDDARSLCEGFTRGIARSTGEILVFSHDDIESLNPALPALLARILQDYDLVGAAGTSCLGGASWLRSGWAANHGIVMHPAQGGLAVTVYGDTRPLRAGIQAVDGLWFACRRVVVEAVAFDADTFDGFHLYDVDYSFRAWRAGFRLAVSNELAIVHQSDGHFDDVWREYARRFLGKHQSALAPAPTTDATPVIGVSLRNKHQGLAFVRAWVGSAPLPDPGDGNATAPETLDRNRWSHLIYDDVDGTELHARQIEFSDRFSAPWRRFPLQRRIPTLPERKLVIGLLSPDLRMHPVGRFIEPLFAHHDRRRLELLVYSTIAHDDAISERLRRHVATWHDAAGWADDRLASQIKMDGIDILVDLCGHSTGFRPQVLARRPAPVQTSFVGYPGATDLESTEVLIADACTEPERQQGGPDLVLMEGSYFCYTPPADAPEVTPPPMLAAGAPTFGFVGNLQKITRASIELWATVLRHAPRSRMLLCGRSLAQKAVNAPIAAMFAEFGIDPGRLVWRDWTAHDEYLAQFSEIDLLLDSTPFNLAMNTCEALWMGVPVLTLSGRRHATRLGRSILLAAGLDRFVAETPETYCAIAAGFIADPHAAADLRQRQRALLEASALLDGASYARRFERAMRELWARRCAAVGPNIGASGIVGPTPDFPGGS